MCCCSANHKLFSICLPFIIFLQHKGYYNLLRRQRFSVLCVCIGCLVWCLCPELYSQPGFWIITIFPVSFQFFFVLILMPPKCKRSEQQRPYPNTRLRPPPIEFVPDAFLTCCRGGLRRLPTSDHRT